ncbi:MAG: ABC transporter ATP-binding protein [Sulfuricurvum sp.]
MIGVAAVLPFINIAGNFSAIHSNRFTQTLYNYFSFGSDPDFVVVVGIILILFYLIRSLLNMGYFYLLAKFSKGRFHLLAYRLFENYLGMHYRDFIEKSSSEISKTIISEANHLTNVLSGLLLMLSETTVVILIYSAMLYVNWKITLLITLLLGFNAIFLIKTVSGKIAQAGVQREKDQLTFFNIIHNTLGNFKLIKLSSTNNRTLKSFEEASSSFALAAIRSETYFHIPRLFLEAVGFGIIIFIVIYIISKYQSDISGALPIISMFILGLYRLMPSANRILNGYNQIIYNKSALDIIHNDLMYDPEDLRNEEVNFQYAITLENVSFEYLDNKPILNHINLTIHRGEKIAFVGESGSGKSTLVDLIIGLYRPKTGKISVDGVELTDANIRSWRSQIGYIPQQIHLFDGTVAENVAFGSKIDPEKVKEVLRQANILEFFEDHHSGIDTPVGDNGVKLSGGQRQRIAIARALYTNPEILVLDEATSALDADTEAKIMEEIYKICEYKTLIVIAHRISTIEKCTSKYEIKKHHSFKQSNFKGLT